MADPSNSSSNKSWADDDTEAVTQQLKKTSVDETSGVDQPSVAVKATELNESEQELKIEVDKDSPYQTTAVKEFRELNLSPEILKGIAELGFNRPSRIQAVAIPAILSNPPQNFIGQAQSGSGKTAAFGLSVLARVDERTEAPQGIIIAPTRELTRQIHDNLFNLAKYTKIQIALALSDTIQKLPSPLKCHIVVGTPGAMVGCIDNRKVDPRQIKIFVLDEADELLKEDPTAQNHAKMVMKRLSPKCQMCLFSATFNERVRDFANSLVKAKVKIEIPPEKLSLDKLFQFFLRCEKDGKDTRLEALDKILSTVSVGQTIIFVHTIATGKEVHRLMEQKKHALSLLYGQNMDKAIRDKTIDDFRYGRNRVLISTNVIARGLDVLRTSLVINYDVPMDKEGRPDPETYLHRIGRSARWQNPGLAITFVHDKASYDKMAAIAQHFSKEIKQRTMESLDELDKELKEYGVTD